MRRIEHSRTSISQNDIDAVLNQMKSGMLTSGKRTDSVIETLSKILDNSNVLLFSSGKSALYQIIRTLNLTSNDDVLIPTYVCHDVADAIKQAAVNLEQRALGEFL